MIYDALPQHDPAATETRLVGLGVPRALLKRLQDPACALDECVRTVERFNTEHPPLQGVRHKLSLAFDGGRSITLYYDADGGRRLGHNGFTVARETNPDRPWSARDPQDPVFKQWFRKMHERYRQHFLQEAHLVPSELNTEEVYTVRFLYEAIGFLSGQPDVSDEVIGYVASAHANLKTRLVNDMGFSGQDPSILKALPSMQGVDVRTYIDTKQQLPRELGERYYGHGLVKGMPWQRLRALLENGIDPSRLFFTEKLLADFDAAVVNGSNRPGCMLGSFTVIGYPDRALDSRNGIAAVVVDWDYRELVPYLQRTYPNVVFTTAENLTPTLQQLLRRAAPWPLERE